MGGLGFNQATGDLRESNQATGDLRESQVALRWAISCSVLDTAMFRDSRTAIPDRQRSPLQLGGGGSGSRPGGDSSGADAPSAENDAGGDDACTTS